MLHFSFENKTTPFCAQVLIFVGLHQVAAMQHSLVCQLKQSQERRKLPSLRKSKSD